MVNFEHLTYDEEDDLKDCTNKVYEWLKSSPDQISFELETASPILQYMMHKELRSTFPHIWTVSGHKCVRRKHCLSLMLRFDRCGMKD